MKKYRSRKSLIEDIEALKDTVGYVRAILLHQNISIIVLRESIKAECDYIDVSYDVKTKILSGRPVYLLSEFRKVLQEEDGESGIFATIEDLAGHISKRRVKLEQLHHWFDGLSSESYGNQVFSNLEIPGFIRLLEPGSFKESVCHVNLSIPTHLLLQLTRAGLEVTEKCKVKLIRTGSFGLNDFVKTEYFKEGTEKKVIDYVEYQSLFKADEYIRVYEDKLTIIRDTKEIKYINNFHYKKFYNSVDELIICLLLAYYRVIVTTDVTLGLLDIYKEIDCKDKI